jgi:hypothetical protein
MIVKSGAAKIILPPRECERGYKLSGLSGQAIFSVSRQVAAPRKINRPERASNAPPGG